MKPPEPSNLKHRLLAGGGFVLVGKALTALSSLVVIRLLKQQLTPQEFGDYGTVFTVVSIGAMVGLLGLHQAVVRLVAEAMGANRPGRARGAVSVAYFLVLPGLLAVAGFLLLGGGRWIALDVWDSPALAAVLGLIAAWVLFQALQILNSETFRGFRALHLASTFGGVIGGLVTMSVLIVWRFTDRALDLEGALTILIGAAALSVVLAWVLLFRRVTRLGPAERVGRGELFSIALPLWISGLTTLVLARSDIPILRAYRGPEEVGIYFGAAWLVAMVSQPLILVNLVVPPYIADLYARGEKRRLERILRNAATVAGVPALLVLLAFLFFGAPILEIVFDDPAMSAAAPVLALLSVGKLVNVLTGSCGVTMSMTGHQQVLMRITLASSVVTVLAIVMVVESYGSVGVAGAVCGGTILHNLWMWLSTRQQTGMWTHVGLPRLSEVRSLLGRR